MTKKQLDYGERMFTAPQKMIKRKAPALAPSILLPEAARAILQQAATSPVEGRGRAVDAAHRRVREMFPQFFQPTARIKE